MIVVAEYRGRYLIYGSFEDCGIGQSPQRGRLSNSGGFISVPKAQCRELQKGPIHEVKKLWL
jgi:hypothetical protein